MFTTISNVIVVIVHLKQDDREPQLGQFPYIIHVRDDSGADKGEYRYYHFKWVKIYSS